MESNNNNLINRQLKTVVFDIGNVLITFSGMDFIRKRFGDEKGLQIANSLFGNRRWSELDRGVMTSEEVLQSFLDADPTVPEEDIIWSFEHIYRTVSRCGYAIPWLRDVRKLGYRVLYLSNYSKLIMHARPEVLDFLPLMDGGIFSCDVKLIKPDLAIYRLLIDRFGLDPEECLFIDDQPDNCAAAEQVGINAYVFGSYEQDRPKIMEILERGHC